jgi:MFS family permease
LAKTQRTTLVLLLLAGLVNFLDRSSLSVANGSIRTELHLSGTQMGLLLSAFSFSYGLAQLPLGPMLDRLGAQRLLGFGVGAWSLTQLLTGGVTGMRTFFPLRVLLGASEAPFFPASVKIVREQFPEEQRGRTMAAVNMSTVVGQALAPPLLTLLMAYCGWRRMFGLMGVIGLALAVVWFLLGRRSTSPRAAGEHFSLEEWLGLFRSRSIWGLMLGFGGVNYSVWFYIAWLPDYLQRGRALSLSASGWLAAIPFIAGAFGMLASGVSADWQDRRGVRLTTVHKRQIIFGMLASAVATACAAFVNSSGAAIACISGALFFIHFAGTSGWGFLQAASPPELLSTIASIQNAGAYMFASLSSALTGWLLDKTHSFNTAFVLCACGAVVGAASYVLIVRVPLGILPPAEGELFSSSS